MCRRCIARRRNWRNITNYLATPLAVALNEENAIGKHNSRMEGITMSNRLSKTFAVAVSLIVSVPLMAHHGNATFDVGKEVTLKGTVTDWFWANPHCILQFDLKGEN